MSRTSGPKSYQFSKQLMFEAYWRVKANMGATGVDGELVEFEADLRGTPVSDHDSTGTVLALHVGHQLGEIGARLAAQDPRDSGRGRSQVAPGTCCRPVS